MNRDLLVPEPDIACVRASSAARPRVAIVAGSGLGGVGDRVVGPVRVPYTELVGYPVVGPLVGHAGELVVGRLGGVDAVIFSGRPHLYQGASARDAAYPARLAAGLGCEVLVLTNASGGVNPDVRPGEIVVLRDHINLTGANPLVGWPGPAGGAPFVPMADAWDEELRGVAAQAAEELAIPVREGVYAGLLGPNYETRAEVDMLRALGADVVGMSTVMEALAARALGLRLVGLSLVTNAAAGAGLSHAEVLEAGERAARAMESLVIAILQRFGTEGS